LKRVMRFGVERPGGRGKPQIFPLRYAPVQQALSIGSVAFSFVIPSTSTCLRRVREK
jgi:hypothetical protein